MNGENESGGKPQWISKDKALQKLMKYCAYQDRCHQEVRNKLLSLGVYGDELDDVMLTLLQENFLNEERFARSFARGKFRLKRWGRVRITRELKLRDISAYCIKKGLAEINELEYGEALDEILHKKWLETKAKNDFEKRKKVADFAIRRGFETNLVWEAVQALKDTD
ncbi:MAG: RecX family transcriptional regulator [Saprospiraceae bacterium]|nr:RecX family transcriptional regulator [Saprospiraceae bacterium]